MIACSSASSLLMIVLFVAVVLQSNAFQGTLKTFRSGSIKQLQYVISPCDHRRQRIYHYPLQATNLKEPPKIVEAIEQESFASSNNNNSTVLVDLQAGNDTVNEEEDEIQIRNTRTVFFFLCWGVTMIGALDRVAMSVALVPLSVQLEYTETMKGSVSSLFSVGYGLGIVPAGILVAATSPRLVMAIGILVWSLATIATPYAATAFQDSMVPLLLARASVGVAESVVLPALQTMLCAWTDQKQRSKTLAIVFTGFPTGTVAAYLISPLIIEYLGGWESLFILYGSIGLFWLIPWMLLAKDQPPPVQQQKVSCDTGGVVGDVSGKVAITPTESDMTEFKISKSIETLKAAPWGGFVKSKGSWAMLLAHAANNWGLYNNLSWSPTFYSEQYGLSVRDSALYSVLPSIAAAAGGLLAGTLSDALLRNISEKENDDNPNKRIEATTNIRKAFQGAALGFPAIALFTLSSHIPEQPWVAQALLTASFGFQAFNAAGYLSANQEKAGEKWAGLLYSITSLPAVMVGTTGVYLTGKILDATNQDWSIVFALNAAVFLLGATSFVALYDSKKEFD